MNSGPLPELSPEELQRYARHLMLPEVGERGQEIDREGRAFVDPERIRGQERRARDRLELGRRLPIVARLRAEPRERGHRVEPSPCAARPRRAPEELERALTSLASELERFTGDPQRGQRQAPRLADGRRTAEEREELAGVVRQFKGSSQKVRRAQILLKADADGPDWTDARIAEAFGVRTKTVENVRQRLVERGFVETLHGAPRPPRPDQKVLDGNAEARVIALRLGPPPAGYANWSLRLLARP